MNFLIGNPNIKLSVEDIKKGIGLKEIKSLHKFLENLHIKGSIRNAFFDISKDSIKFNNPVTSDRLREIGIEYLKIDSR
jgi:hypothetical protein